MVNLNGQHVVNVESSINGKCNNLVEECNNLIWTMKAVDYMNEENQENLSRVHVLCCDKCDFLTISLKSLQQHMTLLHSIPASDFNNLTIFSCQECKCVSTELKLIREHIKIFHNATIENSTNLSISEKIIRNKTAILTPSLVRNGRKSNHLKLSKTQIKMRKKLLQRKSLKSKINHLLTNDMDIENNNNECLAKNQEIKTENMNYNPEIDMSQDKDENDPLDMSINSTTCPFKGTKIEPAQSDEYPKAWKQEPAVQEPCDFSQNNNQLLSNPETCIELIKLTLNQILNKTNEQNRLTHIGFNPASFLQTQFQLPPNIVPLLLPTVSQIQNFSQNQHHNEQSFGTKNLEIDTIMANIQQQNLLKNVSPKVSYHQSPVYLNQKATMSKSNISQGNFVDSNQPTNVYYSNNSSQHSSKQSAKRGMKKQSIPMKMCKEIENSITENLFNRSFLDTSEMETMVTDNMVTLPKVCGDDIIDCHTINSNKSSPNLNDKPHRQNFTSQQNRILSDWFLTHCDKPYPSTEDTKDLSQISGLNYSQVKKWFANKRARSSLNKKSHKSYSLINVTDSIIDDTRASHNDHLSISPSSDSRRSYSNQLDATAPSTVIDFTTHTHEYDPREKTIDN